MARGPRPPPTQRFSRDHREPFDFSSKPVKLSRFISIGPSGYAGGPVVAALPRYVSIVPVCFVSGHVVAALLGTASQNFSISASFIIHHSSFIIHRSSFIDHHSSFIAAQRPPLLMNHYNYPSRLKAIWKHAAELYQAGNREPDTYFTPATLAELASIGLNTMDIYDYVEDDIHHGEPNFETFLMICEARRDYFLTVQHGKPSPAILDASTLPAKTSEARGIVWLPRILPKALAKLRGELPPETMYGCGGDRKFFKANNIHPAEFLRVAWAHETTPHKIIDWVEARAEEVRG